MWPTSWPTSLQSHFPMFLLFFTAHVQYAPIANLNLTWKDIFCTRISYLGPQGPFLLSSGPNTLQDKKSHHVVQLPETDNLYRCPVEALKTLLKSRQLKPNAPLFSTRGHFNLLYKLTTVYFVLTCKLKLSNLSFTTWYTYWTLTSLVFGSNLSPWIESLPRSWHLHRMAIIG